MEYGLKDKVVLLTGGAGGFGRGIAQVFAKEGAKLAITYMHGKERAEEFAEELKEKYGIEVAVIGGDVAEEADVVRMFDECEAALGFPYALINNSGVCPVSMIADTEYDVWKNVINTNLNGTFLMSREFIRRAIPAGKKGRIINIVSQAAFNGSWNGKTPYASSKGGVVSFTLSLAKEVSRHGITVNAVAPGLMFTDMTRELLTKKMDQYNATIPMGRIAEVEEVANAVVYLASDAGSYCTGMTMDVSGGMYGR